MRVYRPKVKLGERDSSVGNSFIGNMLFLRVSNSIIDVTEKVRLSKNHDMPLTGSVLYERGKALSTIVLHKCSVYVIKPITVVDFDNQNSTGSLES
jgi:hypothetical protein